MFFKKARALIQVLRIVPLLCASLCFAGTPVGQWKDGIFVASWPFLLNTYTYKVWLPSGYGASVLSGAKMPVLLLLHGCTSNPENMAEVSRMNDIADREGFIVVYPKEPVVRNPMGCWNFYNPENQARNSGEAGAIHGILQEVMASYRSVVDRQRVYVAGISAGGGMTAIMAACYPDVFAAAAIHSGGMYKAATGPISDIAVLPFGSIFDPDMRGQDAWECGGKLRRQVPMLVFHGTTDIVVNPKNGRQAAQQFVQTNDLADDARDNDSVPYQNPAGQVSYDDGYKRNKPSSTESIAETPEKRAYKKETYMSSDNSKVLVQMYTIEGMNHAWSGGKPGMAFSDPKGPDASQISWDFFKAYTLDGNITSR